MKHYTFTVNRRGLLEIVDEMSYCVFTKPDESGWVRGYAQGSYVPLDLAILSATAPSKVMRAAIQSLGVETMEMGSYVSMGACEGCGTHRSPTWTPSLCEACMLLA